MARRLLLAPIVLALLLAPACKRDETTPPNDDASAGQVLPPEREGDSPPPTTTSAEVEPIECTRPEQFGPVVVSASQYAKRYASTANHFSEVNSTKEQPAEVCGISAGVELLATMTCDDGRNPFGGNRMQAHSSRAGNVGPGGRCESIIDRYVVPCPEGTFDIYIDSYVCADAAAFQ